MFSALFSILGGLLFLTLGAEGLVRGTSSLARRIGVSPLVIGLTVLAYGTSAPEAVVSVQAARGGNPDIALGNVVGSNISNIGLILGTAAILCPIGVKTEILRFDVPLMVGVSVLLLGLLSDQVIGRWNGGVLVVGAVVYTLFCIWRSWDSQSTTEEGFTPMRGPTSSWQWDLLFAGGGLGLLVFGAQFLVTGAVVVAENAGVTTAVVGLTVVAVGTSLPELATSLVAAWRGYSDLALGNVVGSNIFNILGILGLTASIQPVDGSGLSWIDGGVMVGFALITIPLLWTGYTFSRWEGGLLVLAYVVYVVVLVGRVV